MESLTTAASLLFVAGVGVTVALSQWIVAIGSTVLVPVLLRMPPFAPLTTPEMQPVVIGSLMGHVLYGLILGAGYIWLQKRIAVTQAAGAPEREYAYHERVR